MLRTAFVGQSNKFDHKLCEWLSEHTDLRLIIWTNDLAWSHGHGLNKIRKVVQRFGARARRFGIRRSADEFLYYVLYRLFFYRGEIAKIDRETERVECRPRTPLSGIRQVRPDSIRSNDLLSEVRGSELDAMFATCISTYLPIELIEIPRHGTYLLHEGITPEYRGVYAPFWALLRQDYQRIGYTLLRMTDRIDAGPVFVQGRVKGVDVLRDWHSYIGHKAILDSLPEVKGFLSDLEAGEAAPLVRDGVASYYSYPTASALIHLLMRRWAGLVIGQLRLPRSR